jgi:hypothetical protein
MGTTVHFKETITDSARLESPLEIAIGTTTFTGQGPAMFLQVDGHGIILSEQDATRFLQAAVRVSHALGLPDEPSA